MCTSVDLGTQGRVASCVPAQEADAPLPPEGLQF